MKSNPSIAILDAFRGQFRAGVFKRLSILAIGAILCPKLRTVSRCLRVMGLGQTSNYSSYYYALNRAKWSCIALSRVLLYLMLKLLNTSGVLQFTLDDSLVRRYGKRIRMKGRHHDAVRSRGRYKVVTPGLRWLSLQLLCQLPWSERLWSLPVLTIPCLTEKTCLKENFRYRSLAQRSCLILRLLRRWLPHHAIMVLADNGFQSAQLFREAEQLGITLITRSRSDICLFDPPSAQPKGKRGPKPKKGARQTSLKYRFENNLLHFSTVTLNWYQQQSLKVKLATGTALWYRDGVHPIAIRWFVISSDDEAFKPAFFIACHHQAFSALELAQAYRYRWNCEVTFHELRQHLGLETQRHWSHTAMTRVTPLLFGLYTLIVLFTLEQQPPTLPHHQAAWYTPDKKLDASFQDVLAFTRKRLWHRAINYSDSENQNRVCLIASRHLHSLLDTLAFAA